MDSAEVSTMDNLMTTLKQDIRIVPKEGLNALYSDLGTNQTC